MIDNTEFLKLIKKKKLEDFEEEIKSALESNLEKTLSEKVKEIKNKKRIISNDNLKDHIPAKDLFSETEIKNLPYWVQEDIDQAQVIGKSRNIIQVSNGKKYHVKNRLNDLSGGEWTFFLNSVITKSGAGST